MIESDPSLAKARENNTSLAKARESNTSLAKARENNTSLAKARENNTSLAKARENNTSLAKARENNTSLAKARENNTSLAKARETNALLLEIGCEELPARFIPPALEALKKLAETRLAKEALAHGALNTYGTPRRLALVVEDLAARQEDRVREVMGPPRRAAFDQDGNPTKAATGFAAGQGVTVEALQIRATEKGEYVAAVVEEKGVAATERLPFILADMITSLPFPKSMRWGSGSLRFARPLHWILALYGGETVHFEVDGLKSGNITRGHRFLSPGAWQVRDHKPYVPFHETNFVIVEPDERKRRIRKQCDELAASVGGRVLHDEGLLDTVANLVEYPTAVLGRFEQSYLALPRELLITVMKGHQKYFAVEDKTGNLLPCFITISNSRPENSPNIAAGNERVIRARLEDARFYFNEDRSLRLASRLDKLKSVNYQEKLGSVFDKVMRFERIALAIAPKIAPSLSPDDVSRACRLAKADLTTGVVYEFPELQGYMGMTYSFADGERENVARAVDEHYMPRFSGDAVPPSDLGAVVSLADKMDSIAAFFSVGLIPTGSEDPFALRRQTLGVLSILDAKRYDIAVEELVDDAVKALSETLAAPDGLSASIMSFIGQRLSGMLESEGARYDEAAAALNGGISGGVGRMTDLRLRVSAVRKLRESSGFIELVTAAKRVHNILSKIDDAGEPDESAFVTDAERALHDSAVDLERRVTAENPMPIHELVAPVNAFFDAVLVMDKDENIKRNRLALLSKVKAVFKRVADFSRIVE